MEKQQKGAKRWNLICTQLQLEPFDIQYIVDPLSTNINMYILFTVLHIFHLVSVGRIC